MKKTKLKKKLIEKGIKHKWLANRSGLNESILSLIINGKYNADKSQKEKISSAMGMREADLFETD